MNTWLLLLSIIAVLFVVYPLWRFRHMTIVTDRQREDLNITVFREQLAELDTALANSELDPQRYEQLKIELERNLLRDTSNHEVDNQSTSKRAYYGLIAIALLVPLVAVTFYSPWGVNLGARDEYELTALMSKARGAKSPEAAAMLTKGFESYIEKYPENTQVLYGYAHLLMNSHKLQSAVEVFEKLASLVERDDEKAQMLAQKAEILFRLNKGVFSQQIYELVQQALQLDGNNLVALSMMGAKAFGEKSYQQALDYFQQALQQAPHGGSYAQALRRGIAGVRQAMAAANISEDSPQTDMARIKVHVSIADELKDKVSPDNSVFIFAKAVSGPPMPLAAIKTKVKNLPAEFVLDDTMAMTPAMKLSSVEQVNVIARVALSGQPVAKSGDLQGATATPVAVKNEGKVMTLTISEVVP